MAGECTMSALRKAVQDYIEMRRSLGFKLHDAAIGLRKFVAFLEQHNASYITVALSLQWAQENSAVQPVECARRLRFRRKDCCLTALLGFDLIYIARRRFVDCCRLHWSWPHFRAWRAKPITVCWGCYP